MTLTRREACILIPAMMTAARGFAAEKRSPAEVLKSNVYDFDRLQPLRSADHTSYPILEGKTRTGFAIELHETALAPGAQPHPPHRHPAEEIFLIREGVAEVTIDGQASKLTAGSVAYIASNALHGIRNAGGDWARYFVMQLDVEKA